MEDFKLASLIGDSLIASSKRQISFFYCQNAWEVQQYTISTVFSVTGAESLRIARVSNNHDSFYTVIKPLIACMSKQGEGGEVSNEKTNNSLILKFFNKHQRDF